MKEIGERKPDSFSGNPTLQHFRGQELPAHFSIDPHFEDLPDSEMYDGMVVGHNSNPLAKTRQGYKAPDQILVWEQGGVTAMTEKRYKEKYIK